VSNTMATLRFGKAAIFVCRGLWCCPYYRAVDKLGFSPAA